MERFYGTSFDVAQSERNLMLARLARPTDAPVTVEEAISSDRTAKLNRTALTYGLPLVLAGTAVGLTGCSLTETSVKTPPAGKMLHDAGSAILTAFDWFDTRKVGEVAVGTSLPATILDTLVDEVRKGRGEKGSGHQRIKGLVGGVIYRFFSFGASFGALKIGWDLGSAAMGRGIENHVLIANSNVDAFSAIVGLITIAWNLMYDSGRKVLEQVVSIG
jgi:hypothetical protein